MSKEQLEKLKQDKFNLENMYSWAISEVEKADLVSRLIDIRKDISDYIKQLEGEI